MRAARRVGPWGGRWRLIPGAVIALAGAVLLGGELYLRAKAVVAHALISRALESRLAGGGVHRPWPWADMWPVAEIELPRLDARHPVLSGASGESLAFALGHLDGTSPPNGPGHCVIAGHRDRAFAFLRHVRAGDRVVVRSSSREAVYRVADLQIVSKYDTWLLDDAPAGSLTLLTCWPFEAVLPGDLRFAALCLREDGEGNSI